MVAVTDTPRPCGRDMLRGCGLLVASFLAGLPAARAQSSAQPEAPREIDASLATTAPIDLRTAAFLRDWLSDQTHEANYINTQAGPLTQRLQDWVAYRDAMDERTPELREQNLRTLYEQSDSPELRERILHTIHLDPSLRSRQALFIRRYGYYANWFNRFVQTSFSVMSGRFQALLQLPIDAVNDVIGSREADSRQRQAYQLLREAERLRMVPGADPREIAKLEKRIEKALAAEDLENAEWSLHAGLPDAAQFYADQALLRRPDWSRAERLRERAASEAAAARRRALASGQVGYPDRTPPYDAEPAPWLREVLLGVGSLPHGNEGIPGQHPIALVLARHPAPGEGWTGWLREWPEWLREWREEASEPQQRWLRAMMQSERHNPDLKMESALATRRGKRLKYIFFGPDNTRQRAYQAASGLTQTYNALQNLGLFYVFEVFGRGIQMAIAPPPPTSDVLDSMALWLRSSDGASLPETKKIALDLAEEYQHLGRYDDARALLETHHAMTEKRTQKLDRAEGRALLEYAKKLAPGPERNTLIAHVELKDRERKFKSEIQDLREDEKKQARTERSEVRLTWDSLMQWTGEPTPCGLPGYETWFDGTAYNGEISSDGVTFVFEPDGQTLVRYLVIFGEETRVHQAPLDDATLPPRLSEALAFLRTQREEATRTAEQLEELPVPFELSGAAGPSGLDFFPRLLPIEVEPGELELYR